MQVCCRVTVLSEKKTTVSYVYHFSVRIQSSLNSATTHTVHGLCSTTNPATFVTHVKTTSTLYATALSSKIALPSDGAADVVSPKLKIIINSRAETLINFCFSFRLRRCVWAGKRKKASVSTLSLRRLRTRVRISHGQTSQIKRTEPYSPSDGQHRSGA